MQQAIPAAQAQAVPHLAVRDAARAIEFYVRAFGAAETMHLDQPDGRVGHAELTIGGARFMLADEFPEVGHVGPATLGGTTVTISIQVADVDAFAARATAAGATLERPIKDEFFGERVAAMLDPFGHRWRFSTIIEEISNEEMQRRLVALYSPA